MELDPNIILQAKGPQFDNPMDLQAKALQIRHLGLQTQAEQQDYQDNQTLRSLYQKNSGPSGLDQPGFMKDAYSAGLGAKAVALQQAQLGITKTQADIGETVAKTGQANASSAKSQWDLHLDQLNLVNNHISALARDPNLTREKVLDTISSEIKDPDARARALAAVPQDPSKLKDYLFVTGIKNFDAMRQIEAQKAMAPQPEYQDTGAQKVPVDMNPLTNKGQLPTLQKSMTPDEAAKIKLLTSGALTEDTKDFMADRLLNGEKASAVISNLGRGQQGASDLRDIQNRMVSRAKARGISADQLAGIQQDVAASGRTLLELGAREGKIASASEALNNFVDQATTISAKVPRGNWTPITSALQWGAAKSSDPDIGRLQIAVDAVINARARAIGGGTMHVGDQIQGHKLLAAADGPEAFAAKMDQFKQEAAAELAAPTQARVKIKADAAAAKAGPPVPVKSDADYAALKSGTRFVAPDGSVRVKP